jgi:uncharacterized protein (DUF4415 family)
MSDWVDPDEAPLLTKDFFEGAEVREGDKIVRPAAATMTRMGRPPLGEAAKKQVTLRLDGAVIDAFKAGGAGWQSRINDVLLKAVRG